MKPNAGPGFLGAQAGAISEWGSGGFAAIHIVGWDAGWDAAGAGRHGFGPRVPENRRVTPSVGRHR